MRGCTCDKLRRLGRQLTSIYDRELAAVGLRVTQFSLLSQLRRQSLPLTQLADRLDLDRTTLTRNLGPLAAADWVRIDADPNDARVRIACLTPAGEAQWSAGRAHWRRAQDEINARVGHQDVVALHGMLDSCLQLFRATDDDMEEAR